jgi:hypothetical protein
MLFRIQQFFAGFAFMGISAAILNAVYPQLAGEVVESTQNKIVDAIKMVSIRMGWFISFIWVIIRYAPVTPLVSFLLFTLLYVWVTREKTMEPFDQDVVLVALDDDMVLVEKESENWTFVDHENETDWELI